MSRYVNTNDLALRVHDHCGITRSIFYTSSYTKKSSQRSLRHRRNFLNKLTTTICVDEIWRKWTQYYCFVDLIMRLIRLIRDIINVSSIIFFFLFRLNDEIFFDEALFFNEVLCDNGTRGEKNINDWENDNNKDDNNEGALRILNVLKKLFVELFVELLIK